MASNKLKRTKIRCLKPRMSFESHLRERLNDDLKRACRRVYLWL